MPLPYCYTLYYWLCPIPFTLCLCYSLQVSPTLGLLPTPCYALPCYPFVLALLCVFAFTCLSLPDLYPLALLPWTNLCLAFSTHLPQHAPFLAVLDSSCLPATMEEGPCCALLHSFHLPATFCGAPTLLFPAIPKQLPLFPDLVPCVCSFLQCCHHHHMPAFLMPGMRRWSGKW